MKLKSELDEIIAICEGRDPYPFSSHGSGTTDKPAAQAVRKLHLSRQTFMRQLRVIAESNRSDHGDAPANTMGQPKDIERGSGESPCSGAGIIEKGNP